MATSSKSIARGLRYLTTTPYTSHLRQVCPSIRSSASIARASSWSAWALASPSRSFSTTPRQSHGHVTAPKQGEELYVTFIDKEEREHKLAVSKGDNLLDIAQAHDLEMEGACGGSCACSTCHVIVMDQEYFDRMPEAEDDENDMLDLAFGLQETSRLGCQITMTKELDGLRVKLPSMTRNLQASDFGGN
ncbi:2Fe-2S ferredoxin-type domain-containing protein [Xylariales sp. PMI_506]|nr:2Fe-2S ferredoxin-type domain-containing protein [Xylariales sp. PMI_506]